MEIIFDFDGTIVDTFEVGVNIVNRLADRFGSPEMGPREVKTFRNLGYRELLRMMRKKGLSWIKLIRIGRLIHKELHKEIDKVQLFDGVKKVLFELKANGYVLGILSTNTKKNINDFLQINGLGQIFDYVATCRMYLGKTKRLKKLIKQRNLEAKDVICIGDETRDVKVCQKLGIKIMVVTWGYHAKEALEGLKPDWMVDKPEEILKIIKTSASL